MELVERLTNVQEEIIRLIKNRDSFKVEACRNEVIITNYKTDGLDIEYTVVVGIDYVRCTYSYRIPIGEAGVVTVTVHTKPLSIHLYNSRDGVQHSTSTTSFIFLN